MADRTAVADFASEERAFRSAWPDYEATAALDELRAREFARLDAGGHVYLDYTGGGLYARLAGPAPSGPARSRVLGNPHSANPTSLAATDLVEAARRHVLSFFHASPDEYCVDLHGQRQPRAQARRRVVPVRAAEPVPADLRQSQLGQRHPGVRPGARSARPATSRCCRRTCAPMPRRSVSRPRRARRVGAVACSPSRRNRTSPASSIRSTGSRWRRRRGWDVLLDAAAFVPDQPARPRPLAARLRGRCRSTRCSGYPTGVGALARPPPRARETAPPVVRRAARSRWRRCGADRHYLAPGRRGVRGRHAGLPQQPARRRTSASSFIESDGIDVIHRRVRAWRGGSSTRCSASRHDNGDARSIAAVRPGHDRPPGRNAGTELPRPGRRRSIDHQLIEGRRTASAFHCAPAASATPVPARLALGVVQGRCSMLLRAVPPHG